MGTTILIGRFSPNTMEFVNGVTGIITGLTLILTDNALAFSPAFNTMVRMASETTWGAGLATWGICTFLAWRCRSVRCRHAAMATGLAGWLFLAVLSFLTSAGNSVVWGICVGLATGSFLALRRLLAEDAASRA